MTNRQARKLTGYPSIDKPWLKYYSEEAINTPVPECSIYEYMLQAIMENMRMEIWKENGTYRESIKDVNAVVYTNHTWMKKYGTFPFNYDSESENKFLFVKPGETLENEWYIDKNGEFKPGIITKKPKSLEKDNVIKQQDRLSIYR